MSEEDNALTNARSWAENIVEFYHAHQKLDNILDADEVIKIDGEEIEDEDALRDKIQESALSIEVREPWHTPNDPAASPDEYQILLTTGGPALRISGDLGKYNTPESYELEYQNWGTGWTRFTEKIEDLDDALEYFTGCFYYGE